MIMPASVRELKPSVAAGNPMSKGTIHPGPLEKRYRTALEEARSASVRSRLRRKDPSLWPGPAAETAHRLGWLDCPQSMVPHLPEMEAFAEAMRAQGFRRVLLLGMGGSSIAPEMFARLLGTERACPWRSSTRRTRRRSGPSRTASRPRRPSSSPPPRREEPSRPCPC
jgi:hypothetical protein